MFKWSLRHDPDKFYFLDMILGKLPPGSGHTARSAIGAAGSCLLFLLLQNHVYSIMAGYLHDHVFQVALYLQDHVLEEELDFCFQDHV